ncbi:MAG: DNA polymerase III subunit chi [Paracoccaceae bacterium]
MGAVYFYHLTRSPLEVTLPMLLSKAREAGWLVHIRGVSAERMGWLNDKLWLGQDETFLAHGLAGGEYDAKQPILLSCEEKAANGANCLMTVDGADVTTEEVESMQRVCVLFDGNDASALELARGQWKTLSDAGCVAQYWSQENGKWAMKAESVR